MRITAIVQETRSRVRICLDGESAFPVSVKELSSWDLPLQEGQELDPGQAADLLQWGGRLACRAAMDRLLRGDQTVLQLDQFLKRKGFSEALTAQALDYVASYGYLDDERFAEHYLESRRGTMSLRMLSARMRQKGISSAVFQQALDSCGWDDREGIRSEIRKRFPDGRLPERGSGSYQKLCRSLVSKGYGYGEILRVMLSFEQD